MGIFAVAQEIDTRMCKSASRRRQQDRWPASGWAGTPRHQCNYEREWPKDEAVGKAVDVLPPGLEIVVAENLLPTTAHRQQGRDDREHRQIGGHARNRACRHQRRVALPEEIGADQGMSLGLHAPNGADGMARWRSSGFVELPVIVEKADGQRASPGFGGSVCAQPETARIEREKRG